MRHFALLTVAVLLTSTAAASWYWPFGSDEDEEDAPRISKIMEPASVLIDEASDAAADGNTTNAVALYRKALNELGRIESENRGRAQTPEFSTLHKKRAYVNAAIDALLLSEAHANAKAVVVTDTTELEKKFVAKRQGLDNGTTPAKAAPAAVSDETPAASTRLEKLTALLKTHPDNRKLRLQIIGERIALGEYGAAKADIASLLAVRPNDIAALNLRAACASAEGDLKLAETTLDEVIAQAPQDYNGYYNMANLKLDIGAGNDIARRYYESGRAVGGPKDADLEARLK